MKKERMLRWAGVMGTAGTMLFSCLVCGGFLDFILPAARNIRFIDPEKSFLVATTLILAAFNLVYCRLCEGIRVRWAMIVLLFNILVCCSAVLFHHFLSLAHWDDFLFPFLLPLIMIAIAANIVLCRLCGGIQTDWLITLGSAFVLIYLAAVFHHWFDAAISAI
jgi:hypothetical protein